MKIHLIFFFAFLLVSVQVFSQNKETIIDELETGKTGTGTIVIESDSDITALLGTPNKRASQEDSDAATIKTNGYRLLAYMGNDQRKARGEASSRQNLIKEKFTDTGTYLIYNAPNWKLLVGDFVTREEANAFKQLLQKEFPEFGKEAYVVNDIINIPADY